jgi:hypothetical protein
MALASPGLGPSDFVERDGSASRSRGHCFSRTGRDETKLITRRGLVFTSPPDAGQNGAEGDDESRKRKHNDFVGPHL